MSPLHTAAVDGSVEEVELLLSHGANVEQTVLYNIPLMLSCQIRNFETARKLLEHEANINAQVPESEEILGGATPLYFALTGTWMFSRHSTTKETVEFLLEYGADIKKTYRIRPDWADNMAVLIKIYAITRLHKMCDHRQYDYDYGYRAIGEIAIYQGVINGTGCTGIRTP